MNQFFFLDLLLHRFFYQSANDNWIRICFSKHCHNNILFDVLLKYSSQYSKSIIFPVEHSVSISSKSAFLHQFFYQSANDNWIRICFSKHCHNNILFDVLLKYSSQYSKSITFLVEHSVFISSKSAFWQHFTLTQW